MSNNDKIVGHFCLKMRKMKKRFYVIIVVVAMSISDGVLSLFWQEITGGELEVWTGTWRRWIGEMKVTVVTLEMVELKEIDRPPRRLTEEPLNRDNAFIIAALSFIPYAKSGSLFLSLSLLFYVFSGRKVSIVVKL